MSATSSSFYSATESTRDELQAIAELGNEMYQQLESDDDPGAVADNMVRIQDRLIAATTRLNDVIPAMRDVAGSFDAVAAIKS